MRQVAQQAIAHPSRCPITPRARRVPRATRGWRSSRWRARANTSVAGQCGRAGPQRSGRRQRAAHIDVVAGPRRCAACSAGGNLAKHRDADVERGLRGVAAALPARSHGHRPAPASRAKACASHASSTWAATRRAGVKASGLATAARSDRFTAKAPCGPTSGSTSAKSGGPPPACRWDGQLQCRVRAPEQQSSPTPGPPCARGG